MLKDRVLAVLAVALLCLTGCFEVDQEYTLNPDGSGKVIHRVKQPDVMGQGEAGLKSVLEKQLAGAEGVDAWSDLSVEIADDGSFLFTGTAYFSDLNALALEDADAFRFRWQPASGGTHRLVLATSETDPASGKPAASQGDIAKEIREARQEWNQMKPMMQGVLGAFKWRASFHLPSDVVDLSSFEKTGTDVVTFGLTGDRYFQILDQIMNDDAFLEEQARRGSLGALTQEGEELPPELVSKLFGEDGVYANTSASSTPLFDYASSVMDAEANFEATMAALPVDPPKQVVPPARGGDFKSLKVIRTGFVTDRDLAWQNEGASLTIAGELPGSVITAEEGILVAATSDNGANLLPEEEWDRQISVSLDSEDPTKIKFDVSTLLPPNGEKGFREISGVVYYKTASGPDEEVELFSRLSPGAQGSSFGAVLGDFEPGYMEDSEHVSVEIGLPREEISEIVFLDAGGEAIDAQVISTSWSDDSTSLTYSTEGAFPRDGKAIVKVRKDMTTYEIPFKVTNVDWAGRPMK